MSSDSQEKVSRRRFLRGLAGAAGAAALASPILAACAPAAAPSPTAAPAKPAEPTKPAAAPAAAPTTAAAAAPAAPAKTYTFKMSSSLVLGPDSEHWVMYDKFAQLLQERTKGQIKVDYFPSNQLGEEAAIIQQLKLGTVEMQIAGSPIWGSAVPLFATWDLGYLFKDLDHVGRAMDGAPGKTMEKAVQDQAGVQILGWGYGFGWRNVIATKPIEKNDDLKGLKIRVIQNTNYVATLNAMGCVATPMAMGEIYTSLQSGVVDGLEHNAPTILSNKFHEVAKNLALTQHLCPPILIIMSKAKLAELPADLQKTMTDCAVEAGRYQRTVAGKTEAEAMKKLQDLGVKVKEVDRAALQAKVAPVWEQWTSKQQGAKELIDQIQKS